MDRELRKILAACIEQLEAGFSDIEGHLQRYPTRAEDLRRYLELWQRLDATAREEPDQQALLRGQQEMLVTLAEMKGGARRMIPTFLTLGAAKVAAVVVGALVMTGAAAGVSAALGGPNIADHMLSAVGVTVGSQEQDEASLDTAREHAADEAKEGLDTAERAVDDGLNIARDHAADEAAEGLDTADAARESHIPESVPVPDQVPPETTPVPQSIPVPDSAPNPDRP